MKRSTEIGLVTWFLLLALGLSGVSCGKKNPPPPSGSAVVETPTVAPDSVTARPDTSGVTPIPKRTGADSRSPAAAGQHVAANASPKATGVPLEPTRKVETAAPTPPTPSPSPTPTQTPTPAATTPPAKSAESTGGLDAGPRAADAPVDAALASRGKSLFTQKACNTCHQMGARLVGPPLAPVPKQRSAAWIMAMIQRPTEMTRMDPIAKQLLQEYKIQMVLPHTVSADEARALLEFIKGGGR